MSTVPQRYLNVKDFGATGDGVSDDTIPIQSALQQACLVRIPAGKYRVSQIRIPPECRVVGDGCNQTWILPFLHGATWTPQATGGTTWESEQQKIDGPLITDQGNAQKIQIEHLGVSGENRVTKGLVELGFGKVAQWGSQAVINSCQIRDCDGYGLRLHQNISLIERTGFIRCGTAVFALGNELVMNHVQILGSRVIDIWSQCILRNLEIEAPQGLTALNVHRKSLISDIHVSLSQSIEYAIEFEKKMGHVHGFLFDTRDGAKCDNWVKYPGGVVKLPSNVEFDKTETIK